MIALYHKIGQAPIIVTGKEDKLMNIEEMMSFMVAASDAVKDRGKVYEFTCPLCGRTAKAARAKSNGHLHAVCKCGIQFMS